MKANYFFISLVLLQLICATAFANETDPSSKKIWIDRAHDHIIRDIENTAIWFDNFFGDKRSEEEKYEGSYIRWKNEFSWHETDGFRYKNRTHINISLPNATERLRLIYEGERENDLSAVGTEDFFDPKTNSQKFSFRYILSRTFRTKLHVELSVLSVKLRYRYEYAIGNLFVGSITNVLFWKDDERFGDTIQFDLERKLGEVTFLRWSTATTFSETSDEFDWSSGINLAHRLSEKNAISISCGLSGQTKTAETIQNYGLGVNFRRNFYRSWLFFDIEPQLNWQRNEANRFKPEFSIMFRIEVQFEDV